MSITNMQVVTGYYDGLGTPNITSAVSSQLSTGWVPHGAPTLTDVYGQVTQSMVKADNLLTTAYTVITGATPSPPDATWDTLGDGVWIDSTRYIQAYTKGDQVSAKINLSTQVSGVLPVAKGGTGANNPDSAWLNVRPTGSTPLAADPVSPLDAATKQWVESSRVIPEVARSTNITDSNVILSIDTTQSLNGKKSLYSVVDQLIYEIPKLPDNVYISSFANGVLTYVPGNVQVTLRQSGWSKVITPEMFGAASVENSEDTQVILATFAAANASNASVKLSRMYRCNAVINMTTYSGDIFGENMATCGLIFGAGGGLKINNSGVTVVRKPVGLFNFALKATGSLAGVALDFTGVRGVEYARQIVARDIDASYADGTQGSYETVFKLTAAGQSLFDGVNVTGGGTSLPAYRMGKIFDLHSTKNFNVVNGSFQNFDTFMYGHDDTEGVVVFGNHIIAGRRGVVSENNVGNLFQVTNNHFNTSLSAVELGDLSNNGGNHSIITDNFCMVWNGIPEDLTTPYIGFKSCAQYGTFTNNEVLLSGFTKDVTHTLLTGNAAGTRYAANNIISNSRVNNCTRGVHIAPGANTNHISNIQRVGVTLANVIIDEGSNNKSWIFDTDGTFMTRMLKLCTPGQAVAQQIRFHSTTDTTTPSAIFRVSGGTAGTGNDGTAELTAAQLVTRTVRPVLSNAYSCGVSGAAWSGGFTQTAFTVTSDERLKTEPLEITDSLLDAWSEVEFFKYKFKDRVAEKGDDARWHFGILAQKAVDAFTKHGIDPYELGFICYDEWDAEEEVVEDGLVIRPARDAGSKFGIRYEEALVLEAALNRRNYERLQNTLADIMTRVDSLKGE